MERAVVGAALATVRNNNGIFKDWQRGAMPSVKRIPACRVKGCPAPKDPDWHKPHCGHGLEGHHHHVPKRSQGGKRIVAFLCPKCHEEVDNGISLGNQIWKDKDGKEHYLLYDMAKGPNEPIVDRVLEAGSAAEVSKRGAGRGLATSLQSTRAAGEPAIPAASSAAALPASNDYVSRFWRKVDKRGDDECWPWIGSTNPEGYGQFSLDKKLQPAYRVAYELMVGKIPEGLTIDHLCRNPNCVNPTHMEPVTERENIMRGEGVGAKAARVTHCPQGHPYNEENTHIRPKGWRKCRPCDIQQKRDRRKPSPSAAPSASGESSAGELGATTGLPVPTQPGSPAPSSFNKDVWCREGMQLVYWYIAVRDATDEVRFKIGDWYNEGDRVLGEEAPGYLRGFEDVTVRQYSWVAGRVSPDTRVSELSWTMHRAVAALEAPKQKEWLERAQEENLSSKGLYRAIHGEKPRMRRYTADDLRGWANQYGTPPQRRLLLAWIDWLEAK